MNDPRKDGTTAPLSAPIAASSDSISSDAGSLTPTSISPGSAIEAGAAGASGAFVCPAPGSEDPYDTTRPPTWARDLASGNCCYYDNAFLAPEGWARFDTQSECESSCRCADVEPANPDNPNDPPDIQAEFRKVTRESISLECFCGAGFTCYRTLEEAKAALCGNDGGRILGDGIAQRRGCGLVELELPFGYGSESWVFDAATGALVGAEVSGDGPSLPCLSFTMRGGRAFSCSEEITECVLCGESNGVLASTEACP